MIVPFWSWNLSDTTHVRPHTKFQLVWAINTVFTRGGHNVPPPSLKCVAGTPSLLGLTFVNNGGGGLERALSIKKTIVQMP